MDRQIFEHEMSNARAFREAGDKPEYWAGYIRGLRHRYHAQNFGTAEEHELWITAEGDEIREQRSQGYLDAYIPDYCTQKNS